jgi:Flp pilus assembly secretin CpaC
MKNISMTELKLTRVFSALLLCAGLAAFSLSAEELTVIRGATQKIDVTEGIKKLDIGSPKIIDARLVDGGQSALVVGLAEGMSELRIERLQGADVIYNVTVRTDLQGTLDQVKELLSEVVGLETKIVGNKIVFQGKIKTQADWQKVKTIEKAYSGLILNLADFDQQDMADVIKNVILKDLLEIGVDTVTVQVTGETVVLDGVVYSELDMQRAIKKAELRGFKVTPLLKVQQVMIETDLQFVEVDRDKGSSFGQNLFDGKTISLNPSYSGTGFGSRPSLSLSAQTSTPYTINAALTGDSAKSIYQDHLTGVSGEEKSSKLGGTIYVPVAGNVGGSLVPIPYGVIIKVKATMQGKDRILTTVEVEVSTASTSGNQVSTLEFKTSASAISKVGETVVLSGFQQALGTTSVNKTPVLGDIPLLNLLFANKAKSKTHKEGVLLLTPRPSFTEVATGPAFSDQSKTVLRDASDK